MNGKKSMDAIGIAKSAGQRIRKELVNTLLEECDNILRSYYAQMREGADHTDRMQANPPPATQRHTEVERS